MKTLQHVRNRRVVVALGVLTSLFLLAGTLSGQTRYFTGLDATAPELKKASRVVTPTAEVVESGGAVALPASVDLTARFPAPGDQGSIGACGPWAVGYAARSYLHHAQSGGSLTDQRNLFSPSFLYNMVNGGRDQGSSFPELFTVMMTRGAATMAAMPYTTDLTRPPPPAALNEARNFRIRSYYRIEPTNLAAIKATLAEGLPVVFGMEVHQTFMDYRSGVYRGGSGGSLGGHAMALVGYDDARGAFRLMNSWGTRWGESGYGWVAYQAFTTLTHDVWAFEGTTAVVTQQLPVPVQVIAGEGESAQHILLGWDTPDSARVTRFRVYRANPQNEQFEALGEVATTTFTDTTALPGVRYLYAVASLRDAAESARSRVAIGWRAEPQEPPGIVREIVGTFTGRGGSGRVEVRWSPLENTQYYEVLRRNRDGFFSVIGASADNMFADTPPSGTRSADYIVRGVNEFGTGQLSYPTTVVLSAAAADPAPSRAPALQGGRTVDDRTVRTAQQTRVRVEREQPDLFDPAALNRYFQEARAAEEAAFRRYMSEEQSQLQERATSEQEAFQQFLEQQRQGGR